MQREFIKYLIWFQKRKKIYQFSINSVHINKIPIRHILD